MKIYNNPINTYVAEFVGTPAINMFEGLIQENRMTIIKDAFEFELDRKTLNRLNGFSGEVKSGSDPKTSNWRLKRGRKAGFTGLRTWAWVKL